jgi:hypothetical protein
MAAEIDEPTLIEACKRRRVVVTTDQLKRWRVAGLLPRPRQEHVHGLRGSRSWYPAEAVDQAVVVDQLLRDRCRSFDDVRLELWRIGMPVDRAAMRTSLRRPLQQLAEEWSALLRETDGDGAEAADRAVERFGFRDASSLTKLMVNRLGGSRSGTRDMRNVVWFFFLHSFRGDDDGVESGFGSKLESVVAAATGVASARQEGAQGGVTWLPPDTSATDVVIELRDAGAFDLQRMAERIGGATDAELDRARDDVLLFVKLATIVAGMEAIFGPDVAGLASVRALAEDAGTGLPFLVNTMLVLREVLDDEPFEQIEELLDGNLQRYAAIVAIERAFPGGAAILASGEQGIAQLPDDERDALQRALADVIEHHPELAAALD